MKSVFRKWGSHAAVLLPVTSIEEAGYRVGQKVEVNVSRGRIVVQPLEKLEYDLETLVEGITDANSHGEVRFGEPMAPLGPVPAKKKSRVRRALARGSRRTQTQVLRRSS